MVVFLAVALLVAFLAGDFLPMVFFTAAFIAGAAAGAAAACSSGAEFPVIMVRFRVITQIRVLGLRLRGDKGG